MFFWFILAGPRAGQKAHETANQEFINKSTSLATSRTKQDILYSF